MLGSGRGLLNGRQMGAPCLAVFARHGISGNRFPGFVESEEEVAVPRSRNFGETGGTRRSVQGMEVSNRPPIKLAETVWSLPPIR
jgi:hypothetical protein